MNTVKVGLLLLVLSLVSCSNNEGKLKQIMEAEIKKIAKDPDSYQFAEMKIDTVTNGKFASFQYDETLYTEKQQKLKEEMASLKKEIADSIRYTREFGRESGLAGTTHSLIEMYRSNIASTKRRIKQNTLDSIKYAPLKNDKTVVGYIVHHQCRLKNGFGGYGVNVSHASFDKDLKFIRMIVDGEENKYSGWISLYGDFRSDK